jgi:hypothetical protein
MRTLPSSLGRLRGCMHSPEQDLIAEWLVQKGHRAGAQCPRTRLSILMGRNEDERNGAMGRDQRPLEIKAAYPWHSHVNDQACPVSGRCPDCKKSSAEAHTSALSPTEWRKGHDRGRRFLTSAL